MLAGIRSGPTRMLLDASLVTLLLSICSLAQNSKPAPASEKLATSGGTNQVALGVTSRAEVPFLQGPGVFFPIVCNSSGNLFLRTGGPSGVGPLASLSSDGKAIIRFGSDKIGPMGEGHSAGR
jgi:hypothetical protein